VLHRFFKPNIVVVILEVLLNECVIERYLLSSDNANNDVR